MEKNNNERLRQIIRPDLFDLKPYSPAREEYAGNAMIFLDANENPYGSSYRGITGLNRYPDPLQKELKKKISQMTGIHEDSIIAGNGSDEILDLLVRAVTIPGRSNVITVPPTYGMYEVVAAINNIAVKEVFPDSNFIISAEDILKAADEDSRIIFICSPNNPTGNMAPVKEVEILLKNFSGIVVVDEAYIQFSGSEGLTGLIDKYDNLFILRTFSKSWAMAGARLGLGFGNKLIISVLNKIKMPYNINSLSLEAALHALDRKDIYPEQVDRIIKNRDRLVNELKGISGISKVFPSSANFILVMVDSPRELYNYLLEHGIVVRDRSEMPLCKGCLRISIGTEKQTEALIDTLKAFFNGERGKHTSLLSGRRRTLETDIQVGIDLYGRGLADIQTGSGFLDHMLDLFAFHSKTDLFVRASGDINVDMHHTVEDIAITLGQAVNSILRDRKGMNRYGFVMPMDESRAVVSLDICGRSYLVWDVKLSGSQVGQIPASMFKHFFRSLADNAGITVNIEARGEDDHHIIEAVFKGFARALKQAIYITDDKVQSTKYIKD